MEPGTVAYFIDFVITRNIIPVSTVLKWSILDRVWCAIIEANTDVKLIQTLQKKIKRYLWKDPEVYDQYSYKYDMMREEITSNMAAYQNVQIPCMDWCYDDLNESESFEKIHYVSTKSISLEYLIFLYAYSLNPTIRIKLY